MALVNSPVTGLRLLLPPGEGENRLVEGRCDFFVQVFLVPFHRQDIITTCLCSPGSNCFLTENCIPGDNHALKVYRLQKTHSIRDFPAFAAG
jgi:hypothetical protein